MQFIFATLVSIASLTATSTPAAHQSAAVKAVDCCATGGSCCVTDAACCK